MPPAYGDRKAKSSGNANKGAFNVDIETSKQDNISTGNILKICIALIFFQVFVCSLFV